MGGLCQAPFGGPEAVLAYLSRYTHRIAIANSRRVAFNPAAISVEERRRLEFDLVRNKKITHSLAESGRSAME
jgi:hypothetical protein